MKNFTIMMIIMGSLNCGTFKTEIKDAYPDSCLKQENNCGYVFENYPEDRISDIKRMKETISK